MNGGVELHPSGIGNAVHGFEGTQHRCRVTKAFGPKGCNNVRARLWQVLTPGQRGVYESQQWRVGRVVRWGCEFAKRVCIGAARTEQNRVRSTSIEALVLQ